MKKKIDFYFDFLSPYSYVAWTWVRTAPYEFNYIPVSMPGIITHYKTLGPAQIEPKRNYLFRDLLRYTKLHNIPFTTPALLPFNSLYALRLSLAEVAGDFQKEVIDTLFRAGWEHGLDLGNDEIIKSELIKKNLPADELFSKMEDKASRVALKNNNAQALENKLFGVPSFILDNELFWGNDSIKYLEMKFSGNDPLDYNKYQIFLNKHQF